MTDAARRDISNGVWLCASCSNLVDKDEVAFPSDALRKWRELAERAARLRLGRSDVLEPSSASVGYILVAGWEAMRELCAGVHGLIARQMGYRIMETPALASILRATSCVPRSDNSEQKALDWLRLFELGAPVGEKSWPWHFRDQMRRLGVPDSSYLLRRTEWLDTMHGTCGGASAFDDLLPPSFKASKRRQLHEWVRARLPSRPVEWEPEVAEFEIPILLARYPEALCLAVRHELPNGSRLRIGGRDAVMPEIVLDKRAILLPLGWRFSATSLSREPSVDMDAAPGLEREHSLTDPTNEDSELDDGWVEVHHDEERGPPLVDSAVNLFDPSFQPTSLEATDVQGEEVPMPDIRQPHAAREFLSVGIFGMSCPEVFVRCDNAAWRYWGPVLVDALSPALRRFERHSLGMFPAGTRLEVAIREVPGEEARMRCSLTTNPEAGEDALFHVPDLAIGPRDVRRLSCVTTKPGTVHLLVSGFFIRLGGAIRVRGAAVAG